jgi:predicted DNA-binding transcriptional regulator AlpA
MDRFVRKREAIDFSGLGYTQFHAALNDGSFPAPDGRLGPRTPVWLQSTLLRWQERMLAKPQKAAPTPRRYATA